MKNTLTLISTLILLAACHNPTEEKTKGNSEFVADTASKTISANPEFKKKVDFKRFSFSIDATGDSANKKFTLTPSGYSISNDPVIVNIKGNVSDLIAGDIDGDEFPEIAVILHSGVDQEGDAIVYSSNKDRSLSRVSFPETVPDSVLNGYKGHDEFIFVAKNFVRRFPVEKKPGSPKLRHLQYRLVKGEGGKHLVLRNVVDL